MTKRRSFSAEFKREAVRLLESSSKPAADSVNRYADNRRVGRPAVADEPRTDRLYKRQAPGRYGEHAHETRTRAVRSRDG